MAENFDFPALLEGEGPSLDAASILQSQHASDWALRFGDNGAGKNNLMTRKRHNMDIADHASKLQAAREAYQFNELKTSKGALDLFIRGRQLEMDRIEGESLLAERARKAEAAERLLPLELQAKQTQIELNETRSRAALNAELRKAEAEKRLHDHTDKLGEHIANAERSGFYPGSVEYHRAVNEGLRKFPFVPPQMHTDLRESAKIVQRAEDEPVQVTRTQETVGDGTDQIRTERTVTTTKQSREGYEASTPPAAGDFLGRLGLKSATSAPAAPTAQRQTPLAPARPRPAAAPVTAADRLAIARKALNDANASEEHKAAARRILGQ